MWLSQSGNPVNLRDIIGNKNVANDDSVTAVFYGIETYSQSMQTMRSPESPARMGSLAGTDDQK